MIEKFLSEIVVIDTESTGINVKETDVIELATGRMEPPGWNPICQPDWNIQSKLFSVSFFSCTRDAKHSKTGAMRPVRTFTCAVAGRSM